MKKLILIFIALSLLFSVPCFARTVQDAHKAVIGSIGVCVKSYDPVVTVDTSVSVGRYASQDFVGFLYTPSDNECVCRVYAYVETEEGDQTGINYHVRIFTVDGNVDVDAIIGTSAAVAGATINGNATAFTGAFTFSPCVHLTGSTLYAITVFPDDDANLTDDPQIDGTNYWTWGFDNERNLDAIQSGYNKWACDAAIPYEDQEATDDDDDMEVEIWTQ